MIKYFSSILLFWVALASAWPVALVASEIFHWVDADGVNHYSQSPPPTSDAVQTLQIDGSQPASYDPNEDRYNVAAQAESTQAVYDKMAENRKNKQQAKQNTAANTVIYYPDPDNNNQVLYPPGGWYNRPNRPDNRPIPPNRPVQPLLPDFLPEVPARPIRPWRP